MAAAVAGHRGAGDQVIVPTQWPPLNILIVSASLKIVDNLTRGLPLSTLLTKLIDGDVHRSVGQLQNSSVIQADSPTTWILSSTSLLRIQNLQSFKVPKFCFSKNEI